MTQSILKETLLVDKNNQLHIKIPAEMGEEVEVIIYPRVSAKKTISDNSINMALIMDESGFAENILNSSEEDCWNDL